MADPTNHRVAAMRVANRIAHEPERRVEIITEAILAAVAEEREACAQECERNSGPPGLGRCRWSDEGLEAIAECAAAVRSRAKNVGRSDAHA